MRSIKGWLWHSYDGSKSGNRGLISLTPEGGDYFFRGVIDAKSQKLKRVELGPVQTFISESGENFYKSWEPIA